ncbi:hypothetical protein [Ruminiclostridium cellobioparum]|nr:hypothetical protein [Ruminiclostridium cellobioparum]
MYRKNLCEIIEHCMGKKICEVTPYDVGDEELGLKELEKITKFYYNAYEE